MCLNCGCGMFDNDMGNPDNITTKTLAKAAIAASMNGEATLNNVKEAMEQVKKEAVDKKIEELKNP